LNQSSWRKEHSQFRYLAEPRHKPNAREASNGNRQSNVSFQNGGSHQKETEP
jgi:hypothetical protein